MSLCPHCMFPLIGKAGKAENGVSECTVQCTHCSAILRIQITTLRDPNKEKLKQIGAKKSGIKG